MPGKTGAAPACDAAIMTGPVAVDGGISGLERQSIAAAIFDRRGDAREATTRTVDDKAAPARDRRLRAAGGALHGHHVTAAAAGVPTRGTTIRGGPPGVPLSRA